MIESKNFAAPADSLIIVSELVMNILVLLRLTPDPTSDFEILEDGSGIDREWIDYKLNDFDDHALEQAIVLKEASDAKVIVVAVGEGANRALQTAVARGVDEVLVLACEVGELMSSRRTAASVAQAARERGIDLILSGVLAAEDIFGQFAPFVGAMLGWPHISGTSRVSLSDRTLTVVQERSGGVVVNYAVALPAVLGVQTASRPPRYVTGTKLKEALNAPIGRLDPVSYVPPEGATIVALSLPAASSAQDLGDDADTVADEVVRILSGEGLLRGKLQ